MARIHNPILFSTHFSIPPNSLDAAGLIDPFVDVDTQLFIDPVLLEKSSNKIISEEAYQSFCAHFEKVIRLLSISENRGDVAWRGAEKLLDLREPPENGLGYGGSGRSGSSRPDDLRTAILKTATEIIKLGSKDPEMISLMGFFEENVGPDTISDFTTRVISDQLSKITSEFCNSVGINTSVSDSNSKYPLPSITDNSGRIRSIVLVPKDIVRELPIANDWGDIEAAISQSAQIRQQVNAFLAGIAKPTISDRKLALRAVSLQSTENFSRFLESVKEHVRTYDPNLDALSYYKMKHIFAHGFEGIKTDERYELSEGPEEIARLVHDTINLFQHHVENGNLWEELWLGDAPKKERSSQLLYYAIADSYCRANNVDISPEANMGGGPIDFKFSKGYKARVLVEMKRSSGSVRHGYEKQLEIYLDASRSNHGIFVVMDFGDLGTKIDQITEIQARRREQGQRSSDIIVIDATKKASASKR